MRPSPREISSALMIGWMLATCSAQAELVRFEIASREPYRGGEEFGKAGAYEKIEGRAYFAIDPENRANPEIVDLKLAARNESGLVEFDCDLFILAPRDSTRGSGAVLYDVNNRGNKLALRFFNDAAGGNDASDAGHGFLLWRGYTLAWSGWDGELLPGEGRLQLRAPAIQQTPPLTGLVRYEVCPEKAATRLSLVRAGHGAYRPTSDGIKSATLTWRLRPDDRRVAIPQSQFRVHVTDSDSQNPSQLPLVELEVPAGLRKGYLYELIYEAQDPLVHGVCFASVRDLISALKHGKGKDNPLKESDEKLARAYGFGVLQSGRFLREFVYSGFNADEDGNSVFDGLIPHVAGGGLGSFNYRFAQPTAYATQHEYHDWPTDRFPFSYDEQQDPFTKRRNGILVRATKQGCLPKIMHTQSSTEYWSRAGSLAHTDPLGKRDADIPDNVRVYAFGGTQHGPANWPPDRGTGQAAANPGDYRPLLRGLLDRLDQWCRNGREPPPSVFPTLANDTLRDWSQSATGFPAIPGIRYPEVIATPRWWDYGPRWDTERIMEQHPPVRRSDYTVLVPACDEDGNEKGCLSPPEVAVPLATFTGWALRETGAENDLVGLNGSYIPFPKNEAERQSSGDPRKSIQERYSDLNAYLEKLEAECKRLQESGYLVKEDVERIVDRQRERAEMLFSTSP